MLTQEIIRKKRDGESLSEAEIQQFISGMLDASVADSQIAAFAMAVFFQGMNTDECHHLTQCLRTSGRTLSWEGFDFDGPVVDKHSTGGLGDKVSLLIAPLLASCGVYVPMISGRGLGHTGGTLDKMDAIPGYISQPDISLFQKVVKEIGCAIVGQTADLAPADKMLYSIRDITSTVESVPLITASILSKKMAAGLDSLVIDVKVGSASFNNTMAEAETLANSLVEVGNAYGMKTSAILTDMTECLGSNMGNALEVREAVDYLSGTIRDSKLHEVTMALAAELLVTSGQANSVSEATSQLEQALESGSARETFNAMVEGLGGPENFTDCVDEVLSVAPVIEAYYPRIEAKGYLKSCHGRALGNLLIRLGGGRRKADDEIDYSVGFSDIQAIGDAVQPDQPLLMIHAKSSAEIAKIKPELDKIFEFSDTKVSSENPIIAIIRSSNRQETN